MSDIREDTKITIESDQIEDIILIFRLDESGQWIQETPILKGMLEHIRLTMPEEIAAQYEIKAENAEYREIYLQESDIRTNKIWYPRIQPHFLDIDERGIKMASFGVEKKLLNEPLKIEVKGTQNTEVTVHIRILKRE